MTHCNFIPVEARRKRIGIGSLTGITRAQSLTFNAFINNTLRSARLNGRPISFKISINKLENLDLIDLIFNMRMPNVALAVV